MTLTPDGVRELVDSLAKIAEYSDEDAHIEEDRIRGQVLRAIASGAPDAAGLAREALRTDDLDFSHWYA